MPKPEDKWGLHVDASGNVTYVPTRSATEGMAYPVQCRFCRNIHDSAKVEVVSRYSDCSVWRCPGCKNLIDDRPEGWGGSAFPVQGHPHYRPR